MELSLYLGVYTAYHSKVNCTLWFASGGHFSNQSILKTKVNLSKAYLRLYLKLREHQLLSFTC